MTCYVDDMCLSGHGATRRLLYEVRSIIARHGLKSHKAHFFAPSRPKIVTGVVVTKHGIKLPNKRHQKINEEYQALLDAQTPADKLKILQKLVSRVHEAALIDQTWKPKARALVLERRRLQADPQLRLQYMK